eukprot:gene5647-9463_t
MKPDLPLNLEELNNQNLQQHFETCFDRYTKLFTRIIKRNLQPTSGSTKLTRGPDRGFYIRAEKLRHPLIFYFGHTAVFYINKLITAQVLQESDRIDPWLESICAVGVDEMSWDDKLLDIDSVSRKSEDDKTIGTNAWPSVDRICRYRNLIKELMTKIIKEIDLSDYKSGEAHKHPVWAILMGIEHENVHLTTSCPIIRQLPLECINMIEEAPIAPFTHKIDSLELLDEWVKNEGGKITLGASWSDSSAITPEKEKYYQWDIEIGQQLAIVKPFTVRKYSITNAEYLKFVKSGGYQNSEYWTEDSENWNQKHSHPKWWRYDEESKTWKLRLIDREIDLVPFWPVEVNHHESIAYINWLNKKYNKNYRLFTENEYYSLIQNEKSTFTEMIENANINFKYYSPSPVDLFEGKRGICDLVGNVFSHSLTSQYPFENYSVHPYYEDFSLPFLDHRHTFMKGSCFTSFGIEIIPVSRYAYRRHFYQFCGFKLVEGEMPEKIKACPYEKNERIAKLIHSHYTLNETNSSLKVSNFYETISQKILQILKNEKKNLKEIRGLDLGCSVGRLSFELAREFKFVIGIDLINLIQHCHQLRNHNKLCYTLKNGEFENIHDVNFDTKTLQNTQFIQFEFSNLPKTHVDAEGNSMDLSHFEVVSCINLIERVREPKNVLKQIQDIQKKGDYLFLSSSYSWDFNVTKIENCIQTKNVNAEKKDPISILKRCLSNYELVETSDILLVQRSNDRKFELVNCELSIWKKIQ